MANTSLQSSPFASKRLVVGLLLLLGFIASNWIWLDYREFIKRPINFGNDAIFVVAKGSNISTLAKQLHENGQIQSELYLKLLVKLSPELAKIKMGEYQLEQKMKPEKFLQRLTSGAVIQYEFTIIEGQRLSEIIDDLSNEKTLSKPDFLLGSLTSSDFVKAGRKLAAQFGILQDNPEGWFYPETYFHGKNESALSLLQRSVTAMKEALATEWANRAPNLPYKTPYQALIMASIIEKETGIAAERTRIAGVFVRRLQKRMRLQTDPTVIYGIGANFNGDITRKDLKTATPYNTYVIKGLPPTPIATPSRASIYAALHPSAGDELYFVADGSGGHYFSKTHNEHLKAVRRMLDRAKRK